MPTEEIDGNILRINVFGLPNEEQRDCDLVPRPAGIRKTGVVKVLCLKGSETWPMTSSRMGNEHKLMFLANGPMATRWALVKLGRKRKKDETCLGLESLAVGPGHLRQCGGPWRVFGDLGSLGLE